MAEDKEAASGPGRDLSFGGIHLNDADVLLAQSLVTWGGRLQTDDTKDDINR